MKNVLEYLEDTAKRVPDKTAVIDPEGSLTFAGLEEAAKRAGTYLAGRTKPETAVGLYMPKSCRALAAMLGIVYAGCFSVCLSADQGTLRLRKMAETAEPVLILTDDIGAAEETFPDLKDRICSADAVFSAKVRQDVLDGIRERMTDTAPLYCNFTSGSTGTPKGVLVCHRSVIDFMNYFPDLMGITENDVIGNQAPFDFDVSVKDIYSSLKTGAGLVLIPRKYFTVITSLLDYLDDHQVTTLIWAVSALCLVVQLKGFTYRVPSAIRRVLFSGEVMPEKFLKAWMDRYPEADFVNLYGPSEITCNCTYYRVPRGEKLSMPLPVGIPFPNEKVFLLGEDDSPVTEPGKTGEISVSGTCLALGYLNAPEATEQAFCGNPLNKSWPERIYRTGDLGFYNEEGQLCFGGRKDFQIKLFGHRIELEEVELAMNRAEGVERAFCVFNKEKNRLEGYYAGIPDARAMKGELLKLLPAYMVPQRLHQVEKIPVTPNGKIDRKSVLSGK